MFCNLELLSGNQSLTHDNLCHTVKIKLIAWKKKEKKYKTIREKIWHFNSALLNLATCFVRHCFAETWLVWQYIFPDYRDQYDIPLTSIHTQSKQILNEFLVQVKDFNIGRKISFCLLASLRRLNTLLLMFQILQIARSPHLAASQGGGGALRFEWWAYPCNSLKPTSGSSPAVFFFVFVMKLT